MVPLPLVPHRLLLLPQHLDPHLQSYLLLPLCRIPFPPPLPLQLPIHHLHHYPPIHPHVIPLHPFLPLRFPHFLPQNHHLPPIHPVILPVTSIPPASLLPLVLPAFPPVFLLLISLLPDFHRFFAVRDLTLSMIT